MTVVWRLLLLFLLLYVLGQDHPEAAWLACWYTLWLLAVYCAIALLGVYIDNRRYAKRLALAAEEKEQQKGYRINYADDYTPQPKEKKAKEVKRFEAEYLDHDGLNPHEKLSRVSMHTVGPANESKNK